MSNPLKIVLIVNRKEVELLPMNLGGPEYVLSRRQFLGSIENIRLFIQAVQQEGIHMLSPSKVTLSVHMGSAAWNPLAVSLPASGKEPADMELWVDTCHFKLCAEEIASSSFTMGCSAIWPAGNRPELLRNVPLSGLYLKIYRNEGPAVS